MKTKTFLGYRCSCDYKKLWKLSKIQTVVCLLIVESGEFVVAKCGKTQSNIVKQYVRDAHKVYLEADNINEFCKLCKNYDILFILPQETIKMLKKEKKWA